MYIDFDFDIMDVVSALPPAVETVASCIVATANSRALGSVPAITGRDLMQSISRTLVIGAGAQSNSPSGQPGLQDNARAFGAGAAVMGISLFIYRVVTNQLRKKKLHKREHYQLGLASVAKPCGPFLMAHDPHLRSPGFVYRSPVRALSAAAADATATATATATEAASLARTAAIGFGQGPLSPYVVSGAHDSCFKEIHGEVFANRIFRFSFL